MNTAVILDPVPDQRPATSARSATRAIRWLREPMHLVIVVAAAAAMARSAGPVRDIDVYWHILIGREILHTGRFLGDGTGWSFGPIIHSWTTSEWLGEVGLAALYDWGGAAALIAARELITFVLLGGLAVTLLPGRRAPLAALVFSAVAVPLGAAVQERPEIVAYLLLIWLGYHFARLLRGENPPNLIATVLFTAVCANIHGLWVLAPGGFGLLALGSLLEERRWTPQVRRLAGYSLATAAAGCVTPLGPRGLWLPITMHFATAGLEEWLPTTLNMAPAWGLFILMLAAVVAWTRTQGSISRAEVLYVATFAVFGLTAIRNATPAALLLGPVVLDRLSTTFPGTPSATSPRERLVFRFLGLTTAIGALIYVVSVQVNGPTLPSWIPLRITARLAATPGTQRVLNDYNLSGALLLFGGPRVQVAIDGRADAYPAAYRARYLSAEALDGNWRELITQLHPTVAVLNAKYPLVYGLTSLGWRKVMTDAGSVLLYPPGGRPTGGRP